MKKRDAQTTSKIMAAIPSKDTEPELLLRRALWKNKLRYRVNYKKLPGKPDIVFTKHHVAIFCDGDFWHGHNWAIRGIFSSPLNQHFPLSRFSCLNQISFIYCRCCCDKTNKYCTVPQINKCQCQRE